MKTRWPLALVLAGALASFGAAAWQRPLAGWLTDPVGGLDAQDEAVYSHSALRMARHGDWLTPIFMGRYGLYKPPLLMDLAGLSVKLLGASRIALRLPIVLLCTVATGLAFAWIAGIRSSAAGLAGAVLLLSNHLWNALGSAVLTDGVLVAFIIGALFCLFEDPRLDRPAAFWGFALAAAAAVWTKSVAGLLPLAVLAPFWAVCYGRSMWRRALLLCGIVALAVSPWYVYQFAVHPHWFWAEQIKVEIVAYGSGAPPQTSRESRLGFYLARLVRIDPVLACAALLSLPWLMAALRRKRTARELLLTLWIGAAALTALGWSYRSATYLLPLVPALAILAAGYGPLLAGRRGLAVAFACAAVKIAFANPVWGIALGRQEPPPSARALSAYCRQARGNELIIVEQDDAFYATLLPLARVRYAYLGADGRPSPYSLDYPYLGITVTAAQFTDMPRWEPIFRQHLREYNLDSGAPIATVVLAHSETDLLGLIAAHPYTDFYLPGQFRKAVEATFGAARQITAIPTGRFFVLSKAAKPFTPPPGPCEL